MNKEQLLEMLKAEAETLRGQIDGVEQDCGKAITHAKAETAIATLKRIISLQTSLNLLYLEGN